MPSSIPSSSRPSPSFETMAVSKQEPKIPKAPHLNVELMKEIRRRISPVNSQGSGSTRGTKAFVPCPMKPIEKVE